MTQETRGLYSACLMTPWRERDKSRRQSLPPFPFPFPPTPPALLPRAALGGRGCRAAPAAAAAAAEEAGRWCGGMSTVMGADVFGVIPRGTSL